MSSGVLYVAFGARWRQETVRSLTSLKRVSSVRSAVVTDAPWTEGPQPDLFVLREPIASFRCKPRYIYEASPFERTLFLDTDTVVARDVLPVFGLLDHYDVGVRFGGPQLYEPEGLETHAQCNSGVIVFRKSDDTESMFRSWLALYDEAVATVSAEDTRGVGDQRYLAIAIARSRARPVHLGEYLNFATFENLVVYSPPTIYHGRQPWLEKLAHDVTGEWDESSDWQPRVWLPNLAGFLPRGVRRSDPMLAGAFVLRRLWNEMRRRLRP